MKRIKIIIILLMLAVIFPNFTATAGDNSVPVRVGISSNNFSTYLFSEIQFLNANTISITDNATGYSVPHEENSKIIRITSENNLFYIYLDNNLVAKNLTGPITIIPVSEDKIYIKDLKRKGKQAAYRGIIELTRSSKDISKFAIVNVLSLKNYLRGVVPNEMPVRFGLEALKAQTVAARNYAVTPRIKAYQEFDLCDSVACQVYFGANTENELSDKAVEETNGIIALDKENKPILALYSSTAGGYTESYEYAFSDPETKQFPSKDIHYLTAVPDNKDFNKLNSEEEAYKFYTSKPEAYDDLSPYYRWTKEWSKDELEKVLSKTLIAQSKTGFIKPELKNENDFGELISIKPIKRGDSGKIIELEITTDKNVFIVQKELVIRRCFQKNGISLPSANFVIEQINEENPVYKFYGGGFGHGVGLSQWGAGKMASLGFSYVDILQHYYKGIKLASVPCKIYANRKMSEKFFYSDEGNAKVYIFNPCKIKKITIIVNEKEIDVKLKDYITTVNISRHIDKGLNKIAFVIDEDDIDYKKYIEVFTQVKEAKDE